MPSKLIVGPYSSHWPIEMTFQWEGDPAFDVARFRHELVRYWTTQIGSVPALLFDAYSEIMNAAYGVLMDPETGFTRAFVHAEICKVADAIRGWASAGIDLRLPGTELFPLFFGYVEGVARQVEYLGGDHGKLEWAYMTTSGERVPIGSVEKWEQRFPQMWRIEDGSQYHQYCVFAATDTKLLAALATGGYQVLDRAGIETFNQARSAPEIWDVVARWNARAQ